ncbi:MAG: putative sulfate exporter family transporter, partial [Desulfotignum sp.]
MADNTEIVRDVAKWEWSELFRKEDWLAIWLGFIILIVGVAVFLPRPPADLDAKLAKAGATLKAEDDRAPFHTIEWHQANDAKTGLRASKEPHGKTLAKWLSRPAKWTSNPVQALYL